MIIWRGLGILALLGIGLGLGLGSLLAAMLGIGESDPAYSSLMGIGLVIAGVGVYFLGQHLNLNQPARRKAELLAEQRQQYEALIAQERFHGGSEFPWPASQQEARAQSDVLLQRLDKRLDELRNNHTLFFIPMQYVGILAVAGGVVLFLANVFR